MVYKNLTRIDPNMVERIILILYESGREKRTTISRNANMSYDKCVKYLKYLEQINFVKKEVDDQNTIMFSLTNAGIDLCKNKSDLDCSYTSKKLITCLFL